MKDNCTAKISYSFKSKAIWHNESDGTSWWIRGTYSEFKTL